MTYNNFTLRALKKQFGITAADADDPFGDVRRPLQRARRRAARDDLRTVTSGTNWRFLRLRGLLAEVDIQEYFTEDVDKIMGILHQTSL